MLGRRGGRASTCWVLGAPRAISSVAELSDAQREVRYSSSGRRGIHLFLRVLGPGFANIDWHWRSAAPAALDWAVEGDRDQRSARPDGPLGKQLLRDSELRAVTPAARCEGIIGAILRGRWEKRTGRTGPAERRKYDRGVVATEDRTKLDAVWQGGIASWGPKRQWDAGGTGAAERKQKVEEDDGGRASSMRDVVSLPPTGTGGGASLRRRRCVALVPSTADRRPCREDHGAGDGP
jgi:hypothetical protein